MSMEMKRKLRKTLLLAFKIAVGSGQGETPMADNTEMAAVREQRPNPDKSLITAIFFVITDKLLLFRQSWDANRQSA